MTKVQDGLSFGGGGKGEVGTDYMPALSAWAKT